MKNKSSSNKWYTEEPYVHISEKRRKELKEMEFLASADIVNNFKNYGDKMYVNRRDYHLLHPFSKTSRLIDNKAFISYLFSWNKNLLPEVSMYLNEGRIVFCLGCNENNDLRLTPTNDRLKILEINSFPNILLNQMLEPTLMNGEFAAFLKKMGYPIQY